jgi:hypothetical protein
VGWFLALTPLYCESCYMHLLFVFALFRLLSACGSEEASAAIVNMAILRCKCQAPEDFGLFARTASSRVFPLFVWHGGVSLPLVLWFWRVLRGKCHEKHGQASRL